MFRMLMAVWILSVAVFMPLAANANERCLQQAVSATGKPSSIGELARANAFFTWKAVVKDEHGKDYMAWSEATERKLVCIDLMSGENKGKWECTRTARPCRSEQLLKVSKAQCKDSKLKAFGASRPGESEAKAEALAGWQSVAKRDYGVDWAYWEFATNKSVTCRKLGKRVVQCVAEANACRN